MSTLKLPKRSKYKAIPTVVDGIRFDSKLEAKRYGELKLMKRAGEIDCLGVHVRFGLSVGAIEIGKYESDFSYFEKNGTFVVEDCKGFITPLARWKLKHFELQYGYRVRLIKK